MADKALPSGTGGGGYKTWYRMASDYWQRCRREGRLTRCVQLDAEVHGTLMAPDPDADGLDLDERTHRRNVLLGRMHQLQVLLSQWAGDLLEANVLGTSAREVVPSDPPVPPCQRWCGKEYSSASVPFLAPNESLYLAIGWGEKRDAPLGFYEQPAWCSVGCLDARRSLNLCAESR